MVLPIGFFAPLPLPMMIPFMGIQSAVMAEQFGTMFQYGKRRISAMSNEEFNKLTPQMLQERITTQVQGMIPEMEKQIQAMRPMVVIIMKEFAEYVRLATAAIAQGGSEYLEHAAHGHILGHGDTYVPPTESPTETTMCPSGSHWDATRGTCVPDTSTIELKTPMGYPIPSGYTVDSWKIELGKRIEIALQNVKDYMASTDSSHPDYQFNLSRLLSHVTNNHNVYHDEYGEWYSPTLQL